MTNRFKSSLFFKILLIFLAGLTIFSMAMRYSHQKMIKDAHFPKIQQTSVNFSRYIIDAIGSEPDTVRARLMSDSLGVKLRIRNADISWQSHLSIPQFGELNLPVYPRDVHFKAGFDHGLFVEKSGGATEYLIVMQDKQDGVLYAAEQTFLVSIVIFILIILIMFFAVRRLLWPIHQLNLGVTALKEGNIEFPVTSQRQDELGKLIRSFSSMVDRIRIMLQAREQLLLDVSHELRTPLTRVKLSLEMMNECPEQTEISTDIHEMEVMITEILESERMASPHDHLEMGEVEVNGLLDHLLAEFDGMRPGISRTDIPEVVVQGDEKRLRILISNLLANGLKYSQDQEKPVMISGSVIDGNFELIIQNYGVLIPEEDLPFIFEPFYRVDKSRNRKTGGYGLGLNLARRIAEAHQGNLHVLSSVQEGVKAILTLPVMDKK